LTYPRRFGARDDRSGDRAPPAERDQIIHARADGTVSVPVVAPAVAGKGSLELTLSWACASTGKIPEVTQPSMARDFT
jgi:hypothetical protein